MNNESFDLRDIFRLIRRNFWLFSLTLLFCTCAGLTAALYLPKRYKSIAVLNIQTAYFRNPMVNDIVTELHNPAEQSAQRASLLQLALSNDFLDRLGEEHGIYRYPVEHSLHGLEREFFKEDLEYFSLSPTTFQISAVSSEAQKAQQINKAVLEQMVKTLIEARHRILNKTQDVIEGHVQSLALTLKDVISAAPARPTLLESELEKIEASISALQTRYTDRHPEVLKLKRQAEETKSILEKIKNLPRSESGAGQYSGSAAKEPAQELYKELLRKLSYINMSLEMERDRENLPYLGVIQEPDVPTRAFFPKKRMFLLLGAAIGLLLAVILTALAEFRRALKLTPGKASTELDLPLLGELPELSNGKQQLMLEAPQNGGPRKQLPLPETQDIVQNH